MKVGWYYHRLRAMTISELSHRITERWKHRSDASFADSLRGIALGETAESVIALPDRAAAPEALRHALAKDAAALLRGDWKLFGWREVNVGTPPQWHREAVCGVDISADVLSHELDHRALPGGADVRTIWEINRWSEMVRLAMHGWVNGDLKAVQVAISWLEDWCDENPVGYGINWTSPLEAGLRLVNFVWFDALVERFDNGDREALDALKRAQQTLRERIVPAHAAWTWRYKSFGSSANNHLLGELVGLLHAVKRWPALESAICPAEKLWSEISRCVLDQFARDGGNKEQALHYHLFAWEMAWHAARLMRVTEGPVVDRLNKAAEFFVNVAAQGDEQWEYGDNDDAQIVPVTEEREHAVAEWRAWMRGEARGEALGYWLGEGESGSKAPLIPPEGGTTERSSWHIAAESGMAICESHDWKVRLDASPLGYGAMAAHGHGDALHVSFWDGQHALVIDPGTGGYYGMKKQREALAAWEAHNGPQPIPGFQTPRRMGAFLWSDHHDQPTLETTSPRGLTAFFGHDRVDVLRRVEISDAGHVIVQDTVSGSSTFRVRWHLAPECTARRDEANSLLIERAGKTWRAEFLGTNARCEVLEGTASRRYGQFEKCVVLEVTAERSLTSTWSRV